MGSSAKRKKEKKKDFQKPKLKVGKTRPKNTNATETSFAAKSVVFKQQNLSENGRDAGTLFQHNLSLLTSRNETQRRDALVYLTTVCAAQQGRELPQSSSVIVSKAQPLLMDGSHQIRQQLIRLLRSLPADDLGPLDRLLLYTRAGMCHLATDIKLSSLDVLDWLLETNAAEIVSCAGGWVKTLRTFQDLLSWQSKTSRSGVGEANGGWSKIQSATNADGGKLRVRQMTTLSRFLTAGLDKPSLESERLDADAMARRLFPLSHMDAHVITGRSNPYGYLNLFGTTRDIESDMYEDAEERATVFEEQGLLDAFKRGVGKGKREGGEVGRAAALVDKALRLAEDG